MVGYYNANNVKSVRYDIGSNSKTALDNVVIEVVIADPSVEGKETYYRGTVNFASPIDLDDIAAEKANAVVSNVTKEQTFEYNAKEMFFGQGVVDALIENLGLDKDAHVMVKFGDTTGYEPDFEVMISSDAGFHTYKLDVESGESEIDLINNIKNFNEFVDEQGDAHNNAYTEKELLKRNSQLTILMKPSPTIQNKSTQTFNLYLITFLTRL